MDTNLTPPTNQASSPEQSQAQAHTPAEVESLRQLRVLEDRYVNIRRKAQLTDENLLAVEKKVDEELRALSSELTDIRRKLADLTQSLTAVRGEFEHTASIYELKALEKYLGYWEPLQFVTREELARRQNLLKQASGSRIGNTRREAEFKSEASENERGQKAEGRGEVLDGYSG